MTARHRASEETILSMAEQILLLDEAHSGMLLSGVLPAAAAMVELAIQRRVGLKDPDPSKKLSMSRKLVVLNAAPTGVPEADAVLQLMVNDSRPRSAYSMVSRMAGPVDTVVGDNLAARGLVKRLYPKGFVDHSLRYQLLNREVQRHVMLSASATRVVLATTTDVRLGATVDLIRNGGDRMSGEAGAGIQPTLKYPGYPDDIRSTVDAILNAAGNFTSGGG